LSCSSSRGRNSSPDCGCEGFGPIVLLGAICKKTGTGKTIPCKSCTHQSAELRVRSRACRLFRADQVDTERMVTLQCTLWSSASSFRSNIPLPSHASCMATKTIAFKTVGPVGNRQFSHFCCIT